VVKKKEENGAKKWLEKINKAKKVRENWKKQFRVDLAREYYEGRQNPGLPEGEWITLNRIYTHIQSTLPALYNTDPYFYVNLRRSYKPDPESVALYEQMGKGRSAMLNYLKDEIKLKDHVQLCILDAMFAYGVLKTHYYSELEENPDAEKEMMDENGAYLMGEDGNILREPKQIPVHERYCAVRVHPDDFLFDEDAGTLENNWHWVAECVRMPRDEAKEQPGWDKKVIKDLVNGEKADDEWKARQDRKKGSENASYDPITGEKTAKKKDILVFWEIYNLKEKKWCVVAEGAEDYIMEESEFPEGVFDHCYSILRFTLRDDSPYPIPPVSQGLDCQKELNLSRSRLMTHRKRFNRKYEVLVSAFDDVDAEMSKLESGDDGTCIRVMQLGAIQPIKDAPLDQQNLIETTYLQNDLTELLGGVAGEARGISSSDSATQASIMDKRLEIKEGSALARVMDFVLNAARKLDQLVQVHIDADTAVRVLGVDGEATWAMIKQTDYEDIEGEFAYEVNVGSTIPKLPHTERSSWMAFLGMIAQAPQLALSRRLLKQVAEMHHIENDALVDEVHNIAKAQMGGQLPESGAAGSMPGVPQQDPRAIQGGSVGGGQSLAQPGAGNPVGV
jgi:hypothetical protein